MSWEEHLCRLFASNEVVSGSLGRSRNRIVHTGSGTERQSVGWLAYPAGEAWRESILSGWASVLRSVSRGKIKRPSIEPWVNQFTNIFRHSLWTTQIFKVVFHFYWTHNNDVYQCDTVGVVIHVYTYNGQIRVISLFMASNMDYFFVVRTCKILSSGYSEIEHYGWLPCFIVQ